MEVKENALQEELPTSPYHVLQHISEEAVRVAGEALQNVYMGSPKFPQLESSHRRCKSEVVTSLKGVNGFQRWKSQMQKALNWSRNAQEQTFFNPEILANQKRQWYRCHSKSLDNTKYEDPSTVFEHFIIAGIHPDANLEAVEDAFTRRKKWESQVAKTEMMDFKMTQYGAPSHAMVEPQVLFKYPPGKRLPMRLGDLASFCFPGGVKARVLERTPSLSELNQLVYGQEHLSTDDSSFVFSLKVADNATLYGVCLHVEEFVQRPPAIFGAASPLSRESRRCSRFLVSAPRCYCLLTRVPFFELHYETLKCIVAQERLNRITQFVSEVSIGDCGSSAPKLNDQTNENTGNPIHEHSTEWMDSAIPVDSVIELAAAAAGIISDDGLSSPSSRSDSPDTVTIDNSHHDQEKGTSNEERKDLDCCDGYNCDTLEKRCDYVGRAYGNCGSVHMPDMEACVCPLSQTLERLASSESLFSSVRTMESEDEDDGIFSWGNKDASNKTIMEWARKSSNELLQIICSYHALRLPLHGSRIVFKPLEHIQTIEYRRYPVFALGVSENIDFETETDKVKMKLAAIEEAVSLSNWTIATVCRVLSLENVLLLLAGVLLEKQVMIMCPNLGVLSAAVLSLIPMIRPFKWQSLFLPVLPGKMFDFLDAPVPFIVGIQQKPADYRMKTSNFVHVNLGKNQITMSSLPALPQQKELISKLGSLHARLSCEKSARKQPVYRCSRSQVEAASQFSTIMRQYLDSLCSNLTSHTITSVQSNDRVSVLLKDSFVDSFPNKDRPFIKQFVETQMFTVLSDYRLSRHENGYS